MEARIRKVAVFAGAAALAGATAAGVAAHGGDDAAGAPAAMTQRAGGAAGQDSLAAALAEELDLPVGKVQAALEAVRGAGGPGGAPPGGAMPPDDSKAPPASSGSTGDAIDA
jgi:hypothetical protein